MTNKDKELIERVKELNEKRTQGEWNIVGDDIVDHPDRQEFFATICSIVRIADYQSNKEFIALAPQMADLIIKQAEQLRVAKEALEVIASDPYQYGQRVQKMKLQAQQALTRMEEV